MTPPQSSNHENQNIYIYIIFKLLLQSDATRPTSYHRQRGSINTTPTSLPLSLSLTLTLAISQFRSSCLLKEAGIIMSGLRPWLHQSIILLLLRASPVGTVCHGVVPCFCSCCCCSNQAEAHRSHTSQAPPSPHSSPAPGTPPPPPTLPHHLHLHYHFLLKSRLLFLFELPSLPFLPPTNYPRERLREPIPPSSGPHQAAMITMGASEYHNRGLN